MSDFAMCKLLGVSWSFCLRLLPIMLVLVTASCAQRVTKQPRDSFDSRLTVKHLPAPIRERDIEVIKKAPWETWSDETFGYSELEQARDFVRMGDFPRAIDAYGKAQIKAVTLEQKRDVAFRRAGTLLKLGQSKEALNVITRFAELHNIALETLGAKESVIIAFAYNHQKDAEQTLAWFSFAHGKLNSQDLLSRQVSGEIRRVIRGFDRVLLEEQRQKWQGHPLINSVILQEYTRRNQGGQPIATSIEHWFMPETYSSNSAHLAAAGGEGESFARQEGQREDEFSIGALLPLSGRFGEYGKRVREGIELAVQTYMSPEVSVRVVYSDTAGDPQIAANNYENLVKVENVSVVLGPLLAETTESVAAEAELLGVPIVAFTKKSGIPELSPSVFRLGATAKNQAEELVSYAVKSLKLSRFGVVFPEDNVGRELSGAFRQALGQQGLRVVNENSYSPGDEESFREAISSFKYNPVDAIFVAENLEKAWPGLEMLKRLNFEKTIILGPALWDDVVMLRGFGDLVEGAVYVTPFFALSENPETVSFRNAYRDKFGREADLLSAQAYDAARYVLLLANKNNGSGPLFRKSLMASSEYQGITGKLVMTDSGEIYRHMSVVKVVNGEPVEVSASWQSVVFGPMDRSQEGLQGAGLNQAKFQ